MEQPAKALRQLQPATNDSAGLRVVGVARMQQWSIGGASLPAVDMYVISNLSGPALCGLPALTVGGHGHVEWRTRSDGQMETRLAQSMQWVPVIDERGAPRAAAVRARSDTTEAALPPALQPFAELRDVAQAQQQLHELARDESERLATRDAAEAARPPAVIAPRLLDPKLREPMITFESDADYRRKHDEIMMQRKAHKLVTIDDGVPSDVRARLEALLEKNAASFSDGSMPPPVANFDTCLALGVRPNATIEKSRCRRRIPETERAALEAHAQTLIDSGRATLLPGHSDWPHITEAFSVPKYNDETGEVSGQRIVYNLHKSSEMFIQNAAVFASPQEVVEEAARRGYDTVCKIDGTAFYDQFPLDREAARMLPLKLGDKLIMPHTAPMGLSQSANFVAGQMAAEAVTNDNYMLVPYFDDFLLFGSGYEGMMLGLEYIFERFGRAGRSVTFGAKKCKFGLTKAIVLGYEFEKGKFHANRRYAEAVRKFGERVRERRALRSALGVFAFSAASLVPMVAEDIRRLSKEAHRNNGRGNIEWTDELLAAWQRVLAAAADPAVLRPFRRGLRTFVITDGSDLGGAAILAQFDPELGALVIVDAMSITWTAAQQNYGAPDAELQTFREAVERWHHYLIDVEVAFVWLTDSASMASSLNSMHLATKLRHRSTVAFLSRYRFETKWVPGYLLKAVDAMSRLHEQHTPPAVQVHVQEAEFDERTPIQLNMIAVPAETVNERVVEVLGAADVDFDVLRALQEADEVGGPMYEAAAAAPQPSLGAKLPDGRRARLGAGLLFIKRGSKSSARWRLFVPNGMAEQIVEAAHVAAEHGTRATIALVTRHFERAGLVTLARKFCKACIPCARTRTAQTLGNMGDIDRSAELRATRPAEVWATDGWEINNEHFVTFVDRHTRFMVAHPVRNESSAEVHNAMRAVVAVFGKPRAFISDPGSAYGKHAKAYCESMDIVHHTTLPEVHVDTAERKHRVLNEWVRKYAVEAEAHSWVAGARVSITERVTMAVHCANAQPTAPNGVSPHELMFGRAPVLVMPLQTLPDERLQALQQSSSAALREHASMARFNNALLELVQELNQELLTVEQLEAAQREQRQEARAKAEKDVAARSAKAIEWKAGDKVWRVSTANDRRNDKLFGIVDKRSGPWVVVDPAVDGNPMAVLIRLAVPTRMAAAAAAVSGGDAGKEGEAPVQSRYLEDTVDARQLARFQSLPVADDETARAAQRSQLVIHEDEWTADHQLVLDDAVAAAALMGLTPKLRAEAERVLKADRAANELKVRQRIAERERKRQKILDDEAARIKRKAEAQLQEQQEEMRRQRLNEARSAQEFVEIIDANQKSDMVRGRCNNGKITAKRFGKLSATEKQLAKEWREKQRKSNSGGGESNE